MDRPSCEIYYLKLVVRSHEYYILFVARDSKVDAGPSRVTFEDYLAPRYHLCKYKDLQFALSERNVLLSHYFLDLLPVPELE